MHTQSHASRRESGRLRAWQRQCATLYVLLWRIGAQFRSNRNCECATETHNNGNNNNNDNNTNSAYAVYLHTEDSRLLVQKMVEKLYVHTKDNGAMQLLGRKLLGKSFRSPQFKCCKKCCQIYMYVVISKYR